MVKNELLEKAIQNPDTFRNLMLVAIDEYRAKNPMTEADFGFKSCGDTGLIERISSGGDVTTRKFCKVIAFCLKT